MITGDKLETAENIGFSCKLFTYRTHLFRISEENIDILRDKLKEIQAFINDAK